MTYRCQRGAFIRTPAAVTGVTRGGGRQGAGGGDPCFDVPV